MFWLLKTNQRIIYKVEQKQQNEPSPWSSYKQFSTTELFTAWVQEPQTPEDIKMRSARTKNLRKSIHGRGGQKHQEKKSATMG